MARVPRQRDAAPGRASAQTTTSSTIDAGIGGNSAGAPPHRIEPPAGDSEREQRRRDGHDAHVHRHVRRERPGASCRSGPSQTPASDEDPERHEQGTHQRQSPMKTAASDA